MDDHTSANAPYTPNKFSYTELAFSLVAALALVGYGLHGFLNGQLVLPAPRGGFAVTGYLPTGLFLLGAACWAAGFLSVIVDHLDERNNEHAYTSFATWATRLGLAFLGAGILGAAVITRFA
ncbi:hypothetical protein [Geopseudomonas aromaticivorans]